jgi:hypothetical protein
MLDGLAITIDESRRPIVTVRFKGSATDEEFRAYLRDMSEQILARRQKTVTILDAGTWSTSTATQRQLQAEWLREHKDELKRFSLGSAFVIRSPLVRGVLTAIFWIQPMETAHVVVPTVAEAEAWARDRLREAGLDAPP